MHSCWCIVSWLFELRIQIQIYLNLRTNSISFQKNSEKEKEKKEKEPPSQTRPTGPAQLGAPFSRLGQKPAPFPAPSFFRLGRNGRPKPNPALPLSLSTCRRQAGPTGQRRLPPPAGDPARALSFLLAHADAQGMETPSPNLAPLFPYSPAIKSRIAAPISPSSALPEPRHHSRSRAGGHLARTRRYRPPGLL